MSPVDMSKYLGLFVSEATEHLESLGRELLALEKEKTRDRVDAMFRHAHSVKGMASSMGFEGIAVLAHRVEDLVDGVRGDLGLLSREVVDALFAAADALAAQVKAAASGQTLPEPIALLEVLNARVAELTGKPPDPTHVLSHDDDDEKTKSLGVPASLFTPEPPAPQHTPAPAAQPPRS